jgi:glycosyltransferase involved in cell wall biosynthesis
MRKLKIFTWHVHGSYLYYLSQLNHDFYIPVDYQKHQGKTNSYPWTQNLHDLPINEIKKHNFDLILFQSTENYLIDQFEQLSELQRKAPSIYLEHDPPRMHPTDTKHVVDDPDMTIVHVTEFNKLMWDCRRTPTTVIDHGVLVPDNIHYNGTLKKGIVLVNNILKRGRRLGLDIFQAASHEIPLDLYGMGWVEAHGVGELKFQNLHQTLSQYRFFFSPIRYTSLGLSIIEAMMIGLPIIGLATTELVSVIENEKNGYLSNSLDELIDVSNELLMYPELAKRWGLNARISASNRFSIDRFKRDWEALFQKLLLRQSHSEAKWILQS